jgi:hypothetical protein
MARQGVLKRAARKLGLPPTTMSTTRPKLPSVLPSQPALQDGMYILSCSGRYMSCYRMVVSTATKDQINTGLARATNPVEWVGRLRDKICIDFWDRTPIFICAYAGGWHCCLGE